jgi:hypothetical protein
LPTLDEWSLAARGEAPRRYSWGDGLTSCDQHPLAPQAIARMRGPAGMQNDNPAIAALPQCTDTQTNETSFTIGQHVSGASPAGIEDVMLTPGELLASDPDNQFNACTGDSSHCVVFGLDPAAIDSVEPFFTVSEEAEGQNSAPRAVVPHAYSFRCVVER